MTALSRQTISPWHWVTLMIGSATITWSLLSVSVIQDFHHHVQQAPTVAPSKAANAAASGSNTLVDYSNVTCWSRPSSSHNLACPPQLVTYFADVQTFLQYTNCSLEFQRPEEPRVTVLLLSHNNVNLTFHTLQSLLRAQPEVPFELIWFDDRSSDATLLLQERVRNVKLCRSKKSFMYAKANNFAAKHLIDAASSFIYFLNNDVVLAPGALAALSSVLEQHPSAGAVGSMIVNRHGILQEAGSIVWRDGSCHGYGRGEDPALFSFQHMREVDYCSACSLLVRKQLFLELGGFDEVVFPHYYEDSDLQLKVRAAGFQVIYQPRSVVTHMEYASMPAAAAVKLMQVSQKVFRAVWKETLDTVHHIPWANPTSVLCASTRGATVLRVLFVDDRVAAQDAGSGFGRAREIWKAIAKLGHILTVFPIWDQDNRDVTEELLQLGIEVFQNYTGQTPLEEFLVPRAGAYDVVIISRPHNFEKLVGVLRRHLREAYFVYDSEALSYGRDEVLATLTGSAELMQSAQETKAKELALFSQADEAWLVAESEAKTVSAELNQTHCRLSIVRHAVVANSTTASFDTREGLLFIGAYHHSLYYNGDAAVYFITKLFGRIRDALPGIRLFVAGSNPPPELLALHAPDNGVEIIGSVPLWETFNSKRLLVVPHLYGAGIQNKILDALSFGVPVVTWKKQAFNLGLHGFVDGLLVATSEEEMIKDIIDAHSNERLWSQLRENALTVARSGRFTVDSLAEAVNATLSRVPRKACLL